MYKKSTLKVLEVVNSKGGLDILIWNWLLVRIEFLCKTSAKVSLYNNG
jgi:hypothetical protein